MTPTKEELAFLSEDGIPVGWTRVSIETTKANPVKQLIQGAKRLEIAQGMAAYDQAVEKLPKSSQKKAEREGYQLILSTKADAGYFPLDAATPDVVTDAIEFYLAPVSRCPDIAQVLESIQAICSGETDTPAA
jgi:hypothetical protein